MTPLDRSRALAWLRERGVDAEAGDPFRLAADEAVLGDVVLRRLWHSPATLRPPIATDPGAVLLLVPLEGSFSVSVAAGAPRIVADRSCAVVPPGARATITTTTPGARLELLARPARSAPDAPGPPSVVASSIALGALIAVSNAILEAGADRDDPSAPWLAAALESLLSAVLSGAAPA